MLMIVSTMRIVKVDFSECFPLEDRPIFIEQLDTKFHYCMDTESNETESDDKGED